MRPAPRRAGASRGSGPRAQRDPPAPSRSAPPSLGVSCSGRYLHSRVPAKVLAASSHALAASVAYDLELPAIVPRAAADARDVAGSTATPLRCGWPERGLRLSGPRCPRPFRTAASRCSGARSVASSHRHAGTAFAITRMLRSTRAAPPGSASSGGSRTNGRRHRSASGPGSGPAPRRPDDPRRARMRARTRPHRSAAGVACGVQS